MVHFDEKPPWIRLHLCFLRLHAGAVALCFSALNLQIRYQLFNKRKIALKLDWLWNLRVPRISVGTHSRAVIGCPASRGRRYEEL